ncbi:hypothetical protein PO909_011598 [Leuciscus waleckii]
MPSSELPVPAVFPPSLPLLPPLPESVSFYAQSSLSPVCPLAPLPLPLPPLSCVDPSWAGCYPAPPGQVYPIAPSPAADLVTPPRPVALTPLPWLLPPSAPPAIISLTASLGSLILPAPPWSDVTIFVPRTSKSSTMLRLSTLSALSGSTLPPVPLQPSVALAPLQPSGTRFHFGGSLLRLCGGF